jgi:hypothetical protein
MVTGYTNYHCRFGSQGGEGAQGVSGMVHRWTPWRKHESRRWKNAAPAARDLFWEAVKAMSFEDAKKNS